MAVSPGTPLLGEPAPVGDVDLAPDDGLDPTPARLVVKRDGGEQIAVFGHRDRRHLEALYLVQQLPDATGAIEQRELGMQMKVNEFLTHSHSIVDGGLELMSYTTRLMPLTSLTMREDMVARSSCGNRAQSAVIPSRLSIARITAVFS